jgi:hypothetical protein
LSSAAQREAAASPDAPPPPDPIIALREQATTSLVDFARAIDVPGRPVSEDPEEALFRPIETTLAQHRVLLLRTAQRVIAKPYGRLMVLTRNRRTARWCCRPG